MSGRSFATLTLLAGSLLVAARAPAAEGPPDAAAVMEEGNQAFARRDYNLAITRFDEVRRLSPKASGPYLGLGLAYSALDRCPEAVTALEEYLRRRASDPKPEAKAALDSCQARLHAPGHLRVESDPAGAEVRFDVETGPPAGQTPFETTELSVGAHKVYFAKPGWKPRSSDVRVERGVVQVVSMTLDPVPAVVPVPPVVIVSPPVPATPPAASPAPAPASPVAPAPPAAVIVEKPSAPAEAAVAVAVPRKPEARGDGEGEDPARPKRDFAHLKITASDEVASILVNGHRQSSQGRLDLNLPPGLYGIVVEADDYRGAEGSVTLLAGDDRDYTAQVRPLKSHGGAAIGALFTVLAVGAEALAITAHVLASHSVADTSDFQTFHAMEIYGQVGAGSSAVLAAVCFIVDGLKNRGYADEGPAYALVPVTPATAATGAPSVSAKQPAEKSAPEKAAPEEKAP